MRPPAGTVPRAEGPEERSLGAPLSRRQAVCIPGSSLSAWRGCPFSRVSGSSLDVLHSEPAPLVAGAHWPLPGPPIGFSPGSVGAPASPVLTAVLLPLTPPAPLCGAFPWHILKGGDRGVFRIDGASFLPQAGCPSRRPSQQRVCQSTSLPLGSRTLLFPRFGIFITRTGIRISQVFWFLSRINVFSDVNGLLGFLLEIVYNN